MNELMNNFTTTAFFINVMVRVETSEKKCNYGVIDKNWFMTVKYCIDTKEKKLHYTEETRKKVALYSQRIVPVWIHRKQLYCA